MYSQGLPRAKGKPPVSKITYLFTRIPDELMRRKDISPGGKLLLGVVITLAGAKDGSCWLCNASLAERTGLSVIQIRRLLPELEKLGLIERRMDGHRRAGIGVRWAHQIDAGGGIEMGQGAHQIDAPTPHQNGAPRREGEKIKIGIFAPLPEDEGEPPVSFDWRRMAAELR